PIPDKTKVEELITLYKKFAEEFSDDSLAPEYLYKGATLLMNSEQNDEAINLLDRIFKDYPSFNKLPEALFLKAFIYENNIKNINKAREAYKDFLNKYPDSDLADDAKISLENLGKTPEQIIKEFEQKMKQQEDSLAAATAKK
ncbi:MAG: tetratricopeptide repeat protein, partial [Bacteroidales bacterium]